MNQEVVKIGRPGRKAGIHRKLKRICGFCRKEFYNWNERKYCSQGCYWDSMKGKPFVEITNREREIRRQRMLGGNNPMWKGGDSDKERRNAEYKNWRIAVFVRDEFTCQECGYYNGNGEKRKDLNAHHIVRWIYSIELRYEVDNGKTLCVPCHINEHTDRD